MYVVTFLISGVYPFVIVEQFSSNGRDSAILYK